MRFARHVVLIAMMTLVSFPGITSVYGQDVPGPGTMTIGGVVYTDVRDPLRSGLAGVAVTVRGEKGMFEATTGGVIGLWKLDVPQGTYTVTPGKKDYTMQHMVGGWSDGERSITIEVKPENIAANQSIQFLAIYRPEPGPEPPQVEPSPEIHEVRETGSTGGGCAMTSGRESRATDFFAPYAACLSLLWVTKRVDARKCRRRQR